MKFRKDFVTNSSSSSYICEICGEVDGGYDVGLTECGMYRCVNDHIICGRHTEDNYPREEIISMLLSKGAISGTGEELENVQNYALSDYCYEVFDGIPECLCPICRFDEYAEEDIAKYLLRKYGVPRDVVFAEVKKYNSRRRKLYDSEYITYVCKAFDLDASAVAAGWKAEFGTYKNFSNFINKY